jgi:hypothetical protein
VKADNGFKALAQYDINADRRIDSADAVFASLRVWVDANADGVSTPAELLTLQQAQVQYLNVEYENSNKVDPANNERRQISYFVQTDGQVRQLHDVWFERDTATNPDTPLAPVAVPDEIAKLPNVAAFGGLRSLHEAMALDPALAGLVRSFMAELDVTTKRALVDSIILSWTGANAVSFGIDSPYYDERKLFALDVASGEAVYDRNYNERPRAGAMANSVIEDGFATFRNWIYRSLSQTATLTASTLDRFSVDELHADGHLTLSLRDYAQRRAADPRVMFGFAGRY